ncbi:MAG TPA: methionine--tRNA ligase [Candidatus Azoamicus sp. OHIO1]
MNRVVRNILVTSALPYANGNLHLGHILEFIQTDIWVRYHKQIGNSCFYISGDDSHGTPIMLKASNDRLTPDELVNMYYLSHKLDLMDFGICLDNYYTTHSLENNYLSCYIFNKLNENGYIFTDCVNQLYDDSKNIFLPDRYVKGKCPSCYASDQYGDVCEKCSSRYDSIDLIDPVSVISGHKPVNKKSKHYFFNLKLFQDFLLDWCKNNISQVEVVNKLNEWFSVGLKSWDISRDSPYFGILIPNEIDKYFYVWLDAPIGYIASFKNLCFIRNISFDDYWGKNSSFELYHFIGKDIMYFHALFWPAVLKGSDFRLPNDVFVHGFLTINGRKMSKSNGTFVTVRDYLKFFDPDLLRYYFASKLNDSICDIDFNFVDFVSKVNSDLVGKFVNILSRCANIINNNYGGFLSSTISNWFLFEKFLGIKGLVIPLYDKRQYSKVVSLLMKYVEDLNFYIDSEKPWFLVKDKNTYDRAHEVCTTAINLFVLLVINIKPIMPCLAKRVECILDLGDLNWNNFKEPLFSRKVNKFEHLIKRINIDNFNELFVNV